MILDCRLQNSDFHTGTLSRNARQYCANPNSEILNHPSPFPLPPSRSPLGVTLIELLITISIVATLGAFFLGVSTAAMESSRAARTRTLIGKIHNLLMEHMETYATRRVDIDTSTINNPTDPFGILSSSNKNRGILMAFARLDAIRILMKQEMPDRWSDILHAPVETRLPGASNDPAPIQIVKDLSADLGPDNEYNMILKYPSLSRVYLRRYNNIKPTATVSDIIQNQGAECLYMIIMFATADGEARTLFSEQDIGDTDGDGAPEFLDGWGQPISYIRWPAGFAEAELSELMPANADSDHDPFDHYRVQNPPDPIGPGENVGYRLVPLVFSPGPDGDSDLYMGGPDGMDINGTVIDGPLLLNPYSNYSYQSIDAKIGTPMSTSASPYGVGAIDNGDGDNWLDNIHNHLLD